MDDGIRRQMDAAARDFVRGRVGYSFTPKEIEALNLFFSNTDSKVFFITGLPPAVVSALLAMYSRLKNPRGIRGHFVDNVLPFILASWGSGPEDAKFGNAKDLGKFLKSKGVVSLDTFCVVPGFDQAFEHFCTDAGDPELWSDMSSSMRITEFLSMWLDAFGHNSIARTGQVVFCVEDASILAVKSIEWARPAAGYIELSTRYVDVSGKGQYPVADEIQLINDELADEVIAMQDEAMAAYCSLMGDNLDGPFPQFLRERWGGLVKDGLEAAILGESCDVLGNLLPASTLTAVGVAASAEVFPQILKHLYLDDTPETVALADAIADEARRVGLGSFIRHEKPNEWDRQTWKYLEPEPFLLFHGDSDDVFQQRLKLASNDRIFPLGTYENTPRGEFDKLSSEFELASFVMRSVMTYRGWRDVHRQGFCTHLRSRLTPLCGFYVYPKPHPAVLTETFERIHKRNLGLYRKMYHHRVPAALAEYPMSLGNIIPYVLGANLRQWEFCNWQRSKWGVNDEVRSEFLQAERELRGLYPWWAKLSRADLTPHYVFARGKAPLALPSE